MNKYLYRLKNEKKQKALSDAFKFFKLDFDKELQKACKYEFEVRTRDDDEPMDITIYFDKSVMYLPREEIIKTPAPRLKDERLHKLLCEYDPNFPFELQKELVSEAAAVVGTFYVQLGDGGQYDLRGPCDGCVVDEEELDATTAEGEPVKEETNEL